MANKRVKIKDITGRSHQISSAELSVLKNYRPTQYDAHKIKRAIQLSLFALLITLFPSVQATSRVDAHDVINEKHLSQAAGSLDPMGTLYVQIELPLAD